jgi:hypothetical protein
MIYFKVLAKNFVKDGALQFQKFRLHFNKFHANFSVLVVLLHDIWRPPTAARTRVLMEHFNWELFDHPS